MCADRIPYYLKSSSQSFRKGIYEKKAQLVKKKRNKAYAKASHAQSFFLD